MINYLFKKELKRLSDRKYIDKKTIEKFFCCFFLPFHKQTGLIYLGYHIKARDWIPPGGHMKKDEFPLQTVKREFFEELAYKLTGEKIELFDL